MNFNYPVRCLTLLTALAVAGCHQLEADDIAANQKSNSAFAEQSISAIELRDLMFAAGAGVPATIHVPAPDDPKVKLGQALFFDKLLSGNQDIACSTCHHPLFGTSDGLPTAIGIGGESIGPGRALGPDGAIVPRNSPDLFNRGLTEWKTMFWDARVSAFSGYFDTPAGSDLPAGLDSVLAVQALFPPTSREEMRGHEGDSDLGDVVDGNLNEIWSGITERLMANEAYQALFAEAFPDVPTDEIGFNHAANAIAAFEISAFTKMDTPYDAFLLGDDQALSPLERKGAELFFGEAGCSNCHAGSLLSDQKTHAIGAPQLGPGKNDESGLDIGRALETEADSDRFAFRTPPLRNVELTGPYMHSGAYATLEDAIRHHFRPEDNLRGYNGDGLPVTHEDMVLIDSETHDEMLAYLSTNLADCSSMGEPEVDALAAFLRSMTDPSARDMSHLVPVSVPSGLSID